MVPKSVGTYRILRKIGDGGMGDVYEGFDDRIKRHAAIKLLHPQYAANARTVERLHSEATVVNVIRHSSIVPVYDFGRLKDGTIYLVMEYLEGETLADRLQLRATPMSEAEVLPIATQLASALDAAHEHGIVHQDLKPGNIMLIPDDAVLDGERVKLLGMGMVKLAEGLAAQQPMQTGVITGSPSYMAPEQCRGERDIDGKADVYALGVLLYHLFAARPPFVGSTPTDLVSKHLVEPPPPLAALAPGLSRSLVELVHRMLRKEKEQRPTMSAVLAVLKQMRKSHWSAHSAEGPPILSVPEELIGVHRPAPAPPQPLNLVPPHEFFSRPTKILEQPLPSGGALETSRLPVRKKIAWLRIGASLIVGMVTAGAIWASYSFVTRPKTVALQAPQIAPAPLPVQAPVPVAPPPPTIVAAAPPPAQKPEPAAPQKAEAEAEAEPEERTPDCQESRQAAFQLKSDRKYQESFTAFSSAYSICKEPWLLVEMGRAKQRLKEFSESAKLYRQFLAADPEPPENELQRTRELLTETCGEFADEAKKAASAASGPADADKAAGAFKAAYEACKDQSLLLAWGQLYAGASRYQEAIEKYNQLLSQNPDAELRQKAIELRSEAMKGGGKVDLPAALRDPFSKP